jgi:fructosamine-3-kinase
MSKKMIIWKQHCYCAYIREEASICCRCGKDVNKVKECIEELEDEDLMIHLQLWCKNCKFHTTCGMYGFMDTVCDMYEEDGDGKNQ